LREREDAALECRDQRAGRRFDVLCALGTDAPCGSVQNAQLMAGGRTCSSVSNFTRTNFVIPGERERVTRARGKGIQVSEVGIQKSEVKMVL
jgi:hypothetical protein